MRVIDKNLKVENFFSLWFCGINSIPFFQKSLQKGLLRDCFGIILVVKLG